MHFCCKILVLYNELNDISRVLVSNNDSIKRYCNRVCFQINRFTILFLISMQKIADFVNSAIKNYHIDSSTIQNVQACLGKEMKVDGWISIILINGECLVLKFNNGVFMNQGFVVNDEKC